MVDLGLIEDIIFLAGQSLPFVQYVVSLAIVQAVQEEAKKRLKVGTCLAAVIFISFCSGLIQPFGRYTY